MKKKALSLLAALSLGLSLAAPAMAAESPPIPQSEALANIQFDFDQGNGVQYTVTSDPARAFLVEESNTLVYPSDPDFTEEEGIETEAMDGYYAIRANSTFTVTHTGTQDDGSCINVYLYAYQREADGFYHWQDYPHGSYLTKNGSFLDDVMDPSYYGGLVDVHAGGSAQFQIPTEWFDADTIYRLKTVISYPQYDWSFWRYSYFRVDETGVKAGLEKLQGAPASTSGFTDVPAGDYFTEAVAWAVEKGITQGTSATTFSPESTCTTAEIITFLWRANGSPAPAGNHSFSDVTADAYYADAAAWAYEKGLISGDTFGGATPATRAATVTYLWKLAGQPEPQSANSFTDVSGDTRAVGWAKEQGITDGTSATTFSPDATCTRAQIMTFLYRDLAE